MRTFGQLLKTEYPGVVKSSSIVTARRIPDCLNAASNAFSEPASVPVCEDAAFAPAVVPLILLRSSAFFSHFFGCADEFSAVFTPSK